MAKPRRAVRRRRVSARILVSSALIGVTAVATLAVWQMSDTEASVALPAAEQSAAAEESAVIDTVSTPSPTASSSPDPSPSTAPTASAASVDWAAVVSGCKQTVRARDAVIDRAGTGIDHWSQHIQAQTDANAGRISVDGMKKAFMRTRLLGPADVSRYRDALDDAAKQSSSCSTPKGAPSDVAATLGRCAKRQSAQRPVLAAGARGMDDWSSHLAFMRRNKTDHIHNAQQLWIDAWQAAPPNIKAFNRASARFDSASTC